MYALKLNHYLKQKLPWKLNMHRENDRAALTEDKNGSLESCPNNTLISSVGEKRGWVTGSGEPRGHSMYYLKLLA